MYLYLICHGMMAFWYRKQKPDGYRILIPQSPVKDGIQEHEVRLSSELGAANSANWYASTPQPTQYYTLKFACAASARKRKMKSSRSNMALYSQKDGVQLIPNFGSDSSAKIAFVIDIPYPEAEQSARPETYKADPYLPGAAVSIFKVHPRSIPRSNVFRFEIADPSQPIVLENQNNPKDLKLQLARPSQDVKLFLYSGSPTIMSGMTGHLRWFNSMFSFSIYDQLDLTLNPKSKPSCTLLKNAKRPFGLPAADLQHLAEINSKRDFCAKTMRGADPAECVQGPGC
jgi:hypothetical protein